MRHLRLQPRNLLEIYCERYRQRCEMQVNILIRYRTMEHTYLQVRPALRAIRRWNCRMLAVSQKLDTFTNNASVHFTLSCHCNKNYYSPHVVCPVVCEEVCIHQQFEFHFWGMSRTLTWCYTIGKAGRKEHIRQVRQVPSFRSCLCVLLLRFGMMFVSFSRAYWEITHHRHIFIYCKNFRAGLVILDREVFSNLAGYIAFRQEHIGLVVIVQRSSCRRDYD